MPRVVRATMSRDTIDRERYWSILPGMLDTDIDTSGPQNVVIEYDQRLNGGADDEPSYEVTDGIAVVDIVGTLRKQPSLFSRLFGAGGSYMDITRMINEAAQDSSVRGILLRIDSPGGTVSGGSDAADAIYEARKSKPVIAFASDMMASAAYRLGSQATAIYADRDAQVGSIGTYAVIEDMSKMADEMGVKVHVVKAGQFKGAGTPGTEVTDEQLSEVQREVDELNDIFLDEIQRGRGMSAEQVRELADGKVHIGKAAQALGLIDGIATMAEVFTIAANRADERMRDQLRAKMLVQNVTRSAQKRNRANSLERR